jgi:diacylglycerol kinase family enzyme
VLAAAAGLGRRLADDPNVDVRDDVAEARLVANRPVPWQVDGDHLGDAEELHFRHVPDALDLVVPLGSPAFS